MKRSGRHTGNREAIKETGSLCFWEWEIRKQTKPRFLNSGSARGAGSLQTPHSVHAYLTQPAVPQTRSCRW